MSNRIDALTEKREQERKDFGKTEENKEYGSTKATRKSSEDLMKQYFAKR